MRDSRNGSYATMGGWLPLGRRKVRGPGARRRARPGRRLSMGRGRVGRRWARARRRPVRRPRVRRAADLRVRLRRPYSRRIWRLLVVAKRKYSYHPPLRFDYAVDDEDAKGEYYNWFGDCRRLLGVKRVAFALASTAGCAYGLLAPAAAARVLAVAAVGTALAGLYRRSALGGVMGDFLGAPICILELAVYSTIAAEDGARADRSALARLTVVLSLPQAHGQ